MHPHFKHFWRHSAFYSSPFLHFEHSSPHRRMFYRYGPSRLIWFTVGAFAATWFHRSHARGEFRGWGPCGNRRIEEWRAERAAEAAVNEQFPTRGASPQGNNAAGSWSWRPAAPPSSEDEAVRRKWEEKTKQAQETVRVSSGSDPSGVLTMTYELSTFRLPICPSPRLTESWSLRSPSRQ